jgi:hypothetical protein
VKEPAERRSPDKHIQLQDAATPGRPPSRFRQRLLTHAVQEIALPEEGCARWARQAARASRSRYAPDLPARHPAAAGQDGMAGTYRYLGTSSGWSISKRRVADQGRRAGRSAIFLMGISPVGLAV